MSHISERIVVVVILHGKFNSSYFTEYDERKVATHGLSA